MQSIATSRGHMRQKMRQKQVLLISTFSDLKMVSLVALCSAFFDNAIMRKAWLRVWRLYPPL